MTTGDKFYEAACAFLMLALVFCGLIGLLGILETNDISEGIIVDMRYADPNWWIDIYYDGMVRRVRIYGDIDYRVGDYVFLEETLKGLELR